MITVPLEDASPLLADPPRLRAIADRDGFLYLRQLLPPDAVLALRAAAVEFAAATGWLDPAAPDIEARALPGKRIGYYQDPEWVNLQIHVQNRSEMWTLGDHIAIHRALHAVEGRSSYLYLSTANTCRVFSPHPDMATQPHQDAHYVRLMEGFWTVWIPLGDCPRELGPLALSAGSHRSGLRDHTGLGIVDGGVVLPENTVWSTGDLRCGDAILFRPLTLHRSLPNESGTHLRLSADFRYGFWDDSSEIDWRRTPDPG
ncbi:MAG: phytanoyl-CoA dioxygenase family protein [Bryobacteraceae bacterium]